MVTPDDLEDIPEEKVRELLSPSMKLLAQVTSPHVAARIVLVYGGSKLCIGKNHRLPLFRLMTPDQAVALIRRYAPEELEVPRGIRLHAYLRNRKLVARFAKGASIRQLGKEFDLTPRGIRKIFRELEETDPELAAKISRGYQERRL